MQAHFDAVIMGAGPAGSTAAILLARAGWSVALVERREFPRRKVCGECIAASNLPLLDALGIGEDFETRAGPQLGRVALMRGKDTIEGDMPPFNHPRYAWGKALGRETLDTLLLARAREAGAVVLQPWSVRSLSGLPGAYRCDIRAAGSREVGCLQASIVIDARGSWEPVRSHSTVPHREHRASDLFAFKANYRGGVLAERLLPVLSFQGGYGGIVLADGGIITLACCIRADRLYALRRAAPGLPAGDVVGAMLKRECAGVRTALRSAHREGAWLSCGPLRPGIRLCSDDDLLRIGNAAGEAHPIIGEGISMALQSAWMLCGHLVRARQPQDAPDLDTWRREVRDRYAADWRRHFKSRLLLAAVFAHLAMRPVLWAPLLPMLRRWPTFLQLGAQWSGKICCAPDSATVELLSLGMTVERRRIEAITAHMTVD